VGPRAGLRGLETGKTTFPCPEEISALPKNIYKVYEETYALRNEDVKIWNGLNWLGSNYWQFSHGDESSN
jgi:hypothetical protein